MKRGIPIMSFVSQELLSAGQIYKKNPKANFSPEVDDNRIFDFVDLIRGESEDNWIRPYQTAEDIKNAITAQLAYICLLYSQQARKKPEENSRESRPPVRALPREIELGKGFTGAEKTAMISGLKSLHSILSKLLTTNVAGEEEKLKVLWVLGRHASLGGSDDSYLKMSFDRFKQYAFGVTKAQRVFNQLKDFQIRAEIEADEYDGEGPSVELWFKNDENGQIPQALQHYIEELLARHSEDDALELFKRADMTVFASSK